MKSYLRSMKSYCDTGASHILDATVKRNDSKTQTSLLQSLLDRDQAASISFLASSKHFCAMGAEVTSQVSARCLIAINSGMLGSHVSLQSDKTRLLNDCLILLDTCFKPRARGASLKKHSH